MLTPSDSVITVSGTPFLLAPSGTALVIGTSIPIVPHTSPPQITIAGSILTANSIHDLVFGSQTLIQGGTPITVSGTPISLAAGGTDLVVGQSTEVLEASTMGIGGYIMGGFGGGQTADGGGIAFTGAGRSKRAGLKWVLGLTAGWQWSLFYLFLWHQ